ncbi:MAG: hypothetical protein ACRC1Z_19725 [Waterburya sp.]
MMDKKLIGNKQGNKSNWRLVWGAIALLAGASAGIVGILESSAQAAPAIKPAIALEFTRNNFKNSLKHDSLKVAQVGINSPSNAPIPLNLRPRTHIPLPTDSRSRDYDYYSGYDHGYDRGYDDGYYRGKHRDRHRKDTVIIINPATSSTYESYGDYGNYDRDNNQRGYIRIIRNQVSF